MVYTCIYTLFLNKSSLAVSSSHEFDRTDFGTAFVPGVARPSLERLCRERASRTQNLGLLGQPGTMDWWTAGYTSYVGVNTSWNTRVLGWSDPCPAIADRLGHNFPNHGEWPKPLVSHSDLDHKIVILVCFFGCTRFRNVLGAFFHSISAHDFGGPGKML